VDRRRFIHASALAALGSPLLLNGCSPSGYRADLVIVGASTGGVATALAAAKRGLRVILTSRDDWVGGQLTSQGVPPDEHAWIEDQGAPASYRRFRQEVRAAYGRRWDTEWSSLNPGACGVSRICHA